MASYPQNTYVGMRYVPLFDGDWDAKKDYEPLTVVNIEGNSYTSKTFVPAGVSPVGNPEYWAETGNYNAQIEAYRQEVLTFNDRIEANTALIDTLNKTKTTNIFSGYVLLVGDSYAEGYTPDGSVESWAIKLKKKIGTGDNIKIAYKGGDGFYNAIETNRYKYLLETLISNNAIEPDNVTLIICGGGYNDSSDTNAEDYDILTEYLSTFKNAKTFCLYIGYGKSQSSYDRINVPIKLSSSCSKNGVIFSDCSQVLRGDFKSKFSSDNIHPSEYGQTLIANKMFEVITNGDCSKNGVPFHSFDAVLNTGDKIPFNCMMVDGIATLNSLEGKTLNISEIESGVFYDKKIGTLKLDENLGTISAYLINFRAAGNFKKADGTYLSGTVNIKSTGEWNLYDICANVIDSTGQYYNGTFVNVDLLYMNLVTPYNVF